ncbi:MAG: aminotransferase class V-fold PLP-dependent enzyme [Silvanigrellales bacterium]|nr:aminotransferase class V-fold PLP-dependent enzyme [Silvanigrellales bacterium]
MPVSLPLGMQTRSEFPIFANNARMGVEGRTQPLVYLDSAVSAQKPRAVINAMSHFLEHDYGSVHRGAYGLSVRASQAYEEVRERVARFLGPSVSASRIIFTRGTTESLNMLASGLSQTIVDAGARIVVPLMEHHANMVPWQQAALRTECELAYIPMVGKAGEALCLDIEKARKLISRNTRVVSLAHVGNVLGQVNPVKEITALAKAVGALVVLDCAQSMTCFDDDPFSWGVDALAFSAHKLYGPSGIGVLALSPALLESLPPFLFGGGMISNVTLEGSEWAGGPARFEAGTPPIVEAVGLGAALTWLEEKGRKAIHAHSARLATRFREGLQSIKGIEVYSPETGEETIVAFRHEALHAHDLATLLDGSNVAMRAGHHCAWPLVRFLGVDALLRASFAAYSDVDDVDIALDAIKRARLG